MLVFICNIFAFSLQEMSAISLLLAEKDVESGGKSIENDFAYRNNVAQASVQIRLGMLFIIKFLTLYSGEMSTSSFHNVIQ